MDDRKQSLQDLLAKVEAGGPFEGWTDFHRFGDFKEHYAGLAFKAFYGSLDAAMALHQAVLPYGYDQFEVFSLAGEVVLKRTKPIDRFYGWFDGTPARAWLIAILKALIAQEGE